MCKASRSANSTIGPFPEDTTNCSIDANFRKAVALEARLANRVTSFQAHELGAVLWSDVGEPQCLSVSRQVGLPSVLHNLARTPAERCDRPNPAAALTDSPGPSRRHRQRNQA